MSQGLRQRAEISRRRMNFLLAGMRVAHKCRQVGELSKQNPEMENRKLGTSRWRWKRWEIGRDVLRIRGESVGGNLLTLKTLEIEWAESSPKSIAGAIWNRKLGIGCPEMYDGNLKRVVCRRKSPRTTTGYGEKKFVLAGESPWPLVPCWSGLLCLQ